MSVSSYPTPSTSGDPSASSPTPSPPTPGQAQWGSFTLGPQDLNRSSARKTGRMKTTAIRAEPKPSSAKTGSSQSEPSWFMGRMKAGKSPYQTLLMAVPVTEASTTGAKAATPYCPTTTSIAKNTPAIGALNDAATADA